MELKDKFRTGYAAGKDGYSTEAAKWPWWNRLIFWAVSFGVFFATDYWLAHHSALDWGWQAVITVFATAILMLLCSLALDKLRRLSGR